MPPLPVFHSSDAFGRSWPRAACGVVMQLSGHEQQSLAVRRQLHICALPPVDRGAIHRITAVSGKRMRHVALQHEVPLSALADCTARGQRCPRCTNLALLLRRGPSKINHLYCNAIGTPVAYSPQWVRRVRRTGIPQAMPRIAASRRMPAQRILYDPAPHICS